VTFKEVLIKPISETIVSADAFTQWLSKEGFLLEVDGKSASQKEAVVALESSKAVSEVGAQPVFRAVREKPEENKPPILIEIYSGPLSPDVLTLSRIGNKDPKEVSVKERSLYRGAVEHLMHPFVSKDLTRAKERLQIPPGYKRLRRVDDCLASMTTILGDMLIDEALGVSEENLLEELAVGVATTQGMTLAVMMADRRNVPLIIRGGTISFGLAGRAKGLNYMVNTLPEALAQGYFTTGDLGVLMKEENPTLVAPQVFRLGEETPYLETRFYLTGGSPMYAMMRDAYHNRGKPHYGLVTVRRASRINKKDFTDWGVIFTGLE
jgi:hypothetical protein